tara:strand:+ start:753 stop:1106 length:354 start_codon:yes stop_codon:yes gene_type:complete
MEKFTEGIKKWVMLEKKITNIKEEYNLKLKDYKDKKDNLENELTKFMKENELTDSIIKLPDGKIKYNETNISQPITYKFLKEIFTELYTGNNDKADEVINFIKQRRETKKNIKLVYQ